MTEPATATDTNDWTVWQALLGTNGSPKPDSEVTTGYWRLPNGVNGTAIPVATWSDTGFWMAAVNGREIDADSGEEWLEFVAKRWQKLVAASAEDYETALDKRAWPDGTPVDGQRGGMGDNSPPEGSVEALLAEAAGHVESAKALIAAGAAKTEDAVDLASNLAKTLTETKSKVIAAHKVEKEPHLQAGRDVDTKFFPTRDLLEDKAKLLKSTVINPWQVEQDRLRREAAEKARKEAEAAAAAGREAEPPPAEPVKVSTGSRGRKVALVEERFGEITDHEAFAGALGKMKSVVIMAALESAANSLARQPVYAVGDSPMPGMIVRSRKVSR